MRSIDRNVVVLGWVSFFTDMASAMITPILPLYVVTVLHEGVDKLGIIVALATFVSYALRLISGYISDRYGIVKPLVVGGYALSALSKPLIGLSHGYRSVAALKALERLGKALRSAPKDVMIAHYSAQKASGRTFGFHKTLDIAGELSGTLLLFVVLALFGQSASVMRSIFYATLLPGAIGLVLVAFYVQDVAVAGGAKRSFRLEAEDRATIGWMGFYFLFLLFVFSDAFFTMQAKSVGIAVATIPLLFVVSTLVQTLTSYLFGVTIDRIGADRVLLFAYVCGVLAQLLLWLERPWATWGAYGFLGLFTVASLNANRAYIAAHSRNRGSVYGIFYAGVALFGAAGAYICGLLWERLGMQSALLFSLAGSTMAALLFWLMRAGVAHKG